MSWIILVSKTNNSNTTCCACQLNIPQNSLRIAHISDADDMRVRNIWHHPQCFPITEELKKTLTLNLISGYSMLNQDLQYQVRDWFQYIQQLSFQKNKLQIIKAFEDKEEIFPKRERTYKLNQEALQNQGIRKLQQNQKPFKIKLSTKRKGIFLDLDDYIKKKKLFEQMCQYYRQENITGISLIKMLQRNQQSSRGQKWDLAFRCAFGKVYGAMPRCPSCLKGHLKFSFTSLNFYCLGQGWMRCTKTFQFEEIELSEWID